MKAFSPDIFTEQKTADLLNESNSILLPAEKSLIAFKTDAILSEIEARRKFYKRYITESCDNVVMEKMLMDREIEAIHEAYEEYAKTHSVDSILLESGFFGIAGHTDASIDECLEAFDLEVAERTFAAIQEEAKIFSEEISDAEKFKRLQSVDEAFGDKIKAAWEKVLDIFQQAFTKFIQKIKASNTKEYFEKYKKVILEKPFKESDNFKTQELMNGYNRIKDMSIPNIDIMEDNDNKLDSVASYFEYLLTGNHIFNNNLSTEDTKAKEAFLENKSQESMNTFLKTYFCMQGHDTSYNGIKFQEMINSTFYSYMTDGMQRDQNKLNEQIRKIRNTCSNAMKQSGKDSVEVKQDTTAANNPTAESAYSHIFQAYFVLEDGKLTILREADDDENNNQQQNNQNQNDNNDNNNQENNAEQDKAKEKAPAGGIIPNRCSNYAKVTTSILRAELSAIEFIRSNVMKIVRYHVNRYIGNDGYDNKKKE